MLRSNAAWALLVPVRVHLDPHDFGPGLSLYPLFLGTMPKYLISQAVVCRNNAEASSPAVATFLPPRFLMLATIESG